MGLDQYLYAKKYISKTEWNKAEENTAYEQIVSTLDIPNLLAFNEETMAYQSLDVSIKVGYWRKANAIHNWFVENCQGGEDDCRDSYVSREAMSELMDLCNTVLASRGTEDSEAEAELTLPSVGGFFFGSTDYDEYYYDNLKYTAMLLNTLLNDTALESWAFYYSSSW